MDQQRATIVKAAGIVGAIACAEGLGILLIFPASVTRILYHLGFAEGRYGTSAGWLLAVVVVAAFVVASARLPSVRATLVRPSPLKMLALGMALAAGVLEEWVFRHMLMNDLASLQFGAIAQLLVSALAFGVSHGVWGFFGGGARSGIGAIAATGSLGAALAAVYLISGRSLAACVAAHVLIDALLEPGLVLAAIRGEMRPAGRRSRPTDRELSDPSRA
jgi:membrane protease YdiL (CAAX protease family)